MPSDDRPSKNSTVPAGPFALGSRAVGFTVAKKVNDWPTFRVVAEVDNVTEVVSALTQCATVFDLPDACSESPE